MIKYSFEIGKILGIGPYKTPAINYMDVKCVKIIL